MFIVVMGVSGSGKTTVGQALATRLGYPFYDGDDFHSAANVAKMAAGTPLTDEDRAGWLAAIAELIKARLMVGEHGVVACSVLKESYREVLRRYNRQQVKFVYLKGSYEVILARMRERGGHFMKPEMLKSQFAILEEPADILTIDVRYPVEEIVQLAVEQLVLPEGRDSPSP